MTVPLRTSFIGLKLQSPLIVASGPASHDVNQVRLAEEQKIGAIILKTACSDKFEHMRFWPRPRYKLLDWDKQMEGRSKQFTLYSYEQGYSGTLQDYWDFIKACKDKSHVPIIGSIFADAATDWAELAVKVEESGADAIELDISSPHRPGSLDFETTFVAAIRAVRRSVRFPVIVKLAAGPDVIHQCLAAQECGADAVTLCNRIRGFDVDTETQRPILHGYFAGVGGPWAKYYTFRHVAEAAQALKIPISGTGGAISGEDVIKYILLGATTVQILSVVMINGWKSVSTINKEVEDYMKRKEIISLEEIRGKVLKYLTHPDEIIRWSGEPKSGPRNEWK
ncbi:MAG: DHO dh domain-containing protein [Bacteroidetes bacterium]|nr:DHO dh domain-containing protein [Bacteroidota bacterium]